MGNTQSVEIRREIDLRPFSVELVRALELAVSFASDSGHDVIATAHLLAAAIDSGSSACTALAEARIAVDAVRSGLQTIIDSGDAAEDQSTQMTSETWELPDGQTIRMTSPVERAPSAVTRVRGLLEQLGDAVATVIQTAT